MARKIKRGRLVPTDRDREMQRLVSDGNSFSDVGRMYGLSRERVRQILWVCFGITAKDYSVHKQSTATAIEKKISYRKKIKYNKEIRCSKNFGCSLDVMESINGGKFITRPMDYGCPAGKYTTQRNNARVRGIGWDITLPEWWGVWQTSGKYDLRGPGKGYCMARHGDSGPYKVGNVYICTVGQNFSDSYITNPGRRRKTRIHELAATA
jgi:hypothetical protein